MVLATWGGSIDIRKVNGAKIDRFFEVKGGFMTLGRSTVPKSTVFLGEGGRFLTLGKVNGAKIDRFFLGGKKKAQRKIGAKIDRFSGEGGFRSKVQI